MREALVLHAQADRIRFGRGYLSDAITEPEHPEHRCIHAESDGGVATLHAPKRRPTDLGSFSNHLSRQAPSLASALNVGSKLRQAASDCYWEKSTRSGHAIKVYISSIIGNNGKYMFISLCEVIGHGIVDNAGHA